MNILESSPVSATTAGAGIGLTVGSIIPGVGSALGYGVGAAIGAAVDLFGKADQMKKARQKLQEAFYAALLKRYNNQVFTSCLETLGASMLYIQTLGLKPGTPQFEAMLQKKMSTGTCIYSPKEAQGPCGLNLFRLDPQGNAQAIATIDPTGTIKAYEPNVDLALGSKWRQACHEMQLAALQAWAEDLKENMLFDKGLQDAKDAQLRNTITRILVNTGLMALMAGYIIRQKTKIGKYQSIKSAKSVKNLVQSENAQQ